MIRIWTALRKLRVERGWSQAKLAKAIGVSQNTLAKYEKTSDPKWSHIDAVLGKLEATPAELARALGFGADADTEPRVLDPETVVLGFTGGSLKRARVVRAGVRVALVDVEDGNAVVATGPNYAELLESLPPGIEVFEEVESITH